MEEKFYYSLLGISFIMDAEQLEKWMAEDTKLVSDVKENIANYESRQGVVDQKTAHIVEKTKKERARLMGTRKIIMSLHEQRAAKESIIERHEFKIKQIQDRLKTFQTSMEHSKMSMRTEYIGPGELLDCQKKLKEAFQTQAEWQQKMLKILKRRDHVVGQLKQAAGVENKYRERMKALLEKLRSEVEKQEAMKRRINEKVRNIKSIHAEMQEKEPKLRQSHTRMRRLEVSVINLEEQVTRKEEEIRRINAETQLKRDEVEKVLMRVQNKKQIPLIVSEEL